MISRNLRPLVSALAKNHNKNSPHENLNNLTRLNLSRTIKQ